MMAMRPGLSTFVSGLLAGLAPALAGGAEPARISAAETAEVQLEFTQTEESGGAARVSLLMFAPPESIWAVLLSCERSFEYVDGMRGCDVIEGGVEHQSVRQSVKKHWLLPRLDYVLEFERKPFTQIEFRRIEGDLRLLEGAWRFEPVPEQDATQVTHEIRVQPSFPVPRWLVRRSLASDLPDMLQCLRALSGGSGSGRQHAEDRARCPEPNGEDPKGQGE
jgi:hypothetical protein